MTTDTELEGVMRKIEAALRMADHAGSNENEAAVAMGKAQALADAYNIDIAMARVNSQKDFKVGDAKAAPREDNLFNGGLYPYQRNLFAAVAKLNHCLYWAKKGLRKGEKYQHRLVGSKVNILLTRQMADYLQKTVERMARDYVGNQPTRYFTKEAHSFREGAIDRIIMTITQERTRRENEDKAKAAAEQARRSHPAYAHDGNALVILDDVRRAEEIANYDFQYGEGAWHRKEQRQAEWRAQVEREKEERRIAKEKAEREYEEWAAANPLEAAEKEAELLREEARKREEFAREMRRYEKQQERNAARRKGTVRFSKTRLDSLDAGAYYAGSSRGASVRLDPQVSRSETKKLG